MGMQVCVYKYVCMSMYVCMYMYVCMFVCMYVCKHQRKYDSTLSKFTHKHKKCNHSYIHKTTQKNAEKI